MIYETATVVELSSDSMLVETVQQSTCGSCSAQKGCGQGVLAKYLSKSSFFRVNLTAEHIEQFSVGDRVELGIDELAVVRASCWLYLVPLAGLLLGGYLGHLHSELFSILFALLGLFLGGYYSSRHSEKVKNSPEYAPTLVSDTATVRVLTEPHSA